MMTTELGPGDFVTPTVRLLRLLAEGGMGRVWVAEHLGLRSQVVVKLMADEMAARSDGEERFTREAAVAAAVKSPHVVQVFDHGMTMGGVPYIVMELLEGRDLSVHLAERGPMSASDVAVLVAQVGKALSKAHRESIVHRDIKPENIFLCDTEGGEIFAKLLDFGTAKRAGSSPARTTTPGEIMGTPYYMSPEQSVGGETDAASDLWSLGAVAFEALTGAKAFDGPSVGAITIAIHGPVPRLTAHDRDLPPAVDAWFARACAQAPQDRFATVREMTNSLTEAVTGSRPVEQLTESIAIGAFVPRAAEHELTPLTHPLEPLSASLPVAGSERRPATIAAGIVVAAAIAAMIAIVLHRSPSPSVASSSPPVEAAAAAPPAAPPAAPSPAEEAASPAPIVKAPAPTVKAPAPTVKTPAPAARARDGAIAKASKRGARGTDTGRGREDDDLTRLANIAVPSAPASESAERPAPPLPAPPSNP